MTPEQARDAVISRLKTVLDAHLPTLKVVYENADTVSIDTVGDFFLRVSVDINSATQASVEAGPLVRYTGELRLMHAAKEGTGTKALMARADTLNSAMKYLNLAGLQTTTPYPGGKEAHDGWFVQEWCIPFFFHQ